MENEEPFPQRNLSDHALTALRHFYSEQDMQKQRFEELKSVTEQSNSATRFSMDMFAEDWNASQFWYSEDTAVALATELLSEATNDTQIAVISAPSVFVQLKNLLNDDVIAHERPGIYLLEYDDRFSVFPELHQYDFRQPLKLDPSLKGRFDRILCDPPFLSEDCQTKTAITVRWLARTRGEEEKATSPRVLICTGERMEQLIHRIYPGTRTTTFRPHHAQDRLGNEFRCYANYESNLWALE
ncbi:uncharacterized protein KY384_005827 [Bacidia gigantensis]|uniref:uncharacterized protein n=1 Tax=Bacidia gigantensis TaxID=2732470 RepID=UPI001D053E00|nr:uncharacterized protein KY384_005827 [Bacidia gigantensis]KAG8529192.1 hypothetical protein KY384_005827 [Bacidia gigantensis]